MSSNYLGRIVGSSSLVDYLQSKAQSKDLQPANDHIQYFPVQSHNSDNDKASQIPVLPVIEAANYESMSSNLDITPELNSLAEGVINSAIDFSGKIGMSAYYMKCMVENIFSFLFKLYSSEFTPSSPNSRKDSIKHDLKELSRFMSNYNFDEDYNNKFKLSTHTQAEQIKIISLPGVGTVNATRVCQTPNVEIYLTACGKIIGVSSKNKNGRLSNGWVLYDEDTGVDFEVFRQIFLAVDTKLSACFDPITPVTPVTPVIPVIPVTPVTHVEDIVDNLNASNANNNISVAVPTQTSGQNFLAAADEYRNFPTDYYEYRKSKIEWRKFKQETNLYSWNGGIV
ncbi:MAG: hypothetical protein QG673_93 [Pseudomonadota bacterium]|nr:hypothetical protein [Pseudomonadota bacterium]